jgi:hypothetical protein
MLDCNLIGRTVLESILGRSKYIKVALLLLPAAGSLSADMKNFISMKLNILIVPRSQHNKREADIQYNKFCTTMSYLPAS